jgi:hypothetical protein
MRRTLWALAGKRVFKSRAEYSLTVTTAAAASIRLGSDTTKSRGAKISLACAVKL